MRIVDESLLEEFRRKRICEWCGKPGPVEPHHLTSKGFGSATRLDVRLNLAALCRRCHDDAHFGRFTRACLLAVVAAREGTTQQAIMDEIYRLRRITR